MNEIAWTDKAVGDLRKLDRQVARRIVRKTRWLADNYKQITPEPLAGISKDLIN